MSASDKLPSNTSSGAKECVKRELTLPNDAAEARCSRGCFLWGRRLDSGGIELSLFGKDRMTRTTDELLSFDLSEKTSPTVYSRSRSLESASWSL